ncbi:rod shape-determining protein MreC [Comamonas sp. BIGb0124]|uniref:rod shape-determining protein MreC n=1 Tax=Comamonas sp. BIGb0124 TaxID=2485130 RepID=UPI000F49C50D|nr:rod shape-determining protein MreC [Comamonas sp. BIGb0124]ROR20734.1 rod shape-determining protein MreC [Comamonas sp. BIGb0124]
MPLGTLDRRPPSFFKQETPAFVRLLVCFALAVFLMVADTRFQVTQPLRAVVAAALYPLQESVLKPVRAVQSSTAYVRSLEDAHAAQAQAEQRLMAQTLRAAQAEALLDENTRLRELLGLRARLTTTTQAAEVLHDTADPYTRRVTIDKGSLQGISAGSPVMDAHGVLGQVTRAYPFTSEVSLVIDQDMVIPVMNLRTGSRAIAYGNPALLADGALELRFVQNDADVQVGDMLTTNGIDGIYPPGLPVAEVIQVERRSDSAFLRIHARPQAHLRGLRHVMVLAPLTRPDEPVGQAPAPQDAASGNPVPPAGSTQAGNGTPPPAATARTAPAAAAARTAPAAPAGAR